MKTQILCPDFYKFESELLPPPELHALIVQAQAGDVGSRNKVVLTMRQWILYAQKLRVYKGVTKEDLYDLSIDAIYAAIEDYDPTKGSSFVSWTMSKLRGGMWTYVEKSRRSGLDEGNPEELELRSEDQGKEDVAHSKEMVERILKGIEPHHRKILELRFGLNGNAETSAETMAEMESTRRGVRVVRQTCSYQIFCALKMAARKISSTRELRR